ncbi:armadillo-type protein [Xylariaceae sp. FL0804]|nr:armadillo-type protein [Xylariaceae sp. FL0804]
MAWQPNPESLSQLATCLKDSLSGFDKAAQKQAELMLTQAKSSPDINNYLVYLFSSHGPPAGVQLSHQDFYLVRSAAAIMLKNNIKTGFKQIPQSSLTLIRMSIPGGLADENSQMRNYTGNITTELIRRGGLMSWPELLPELLKMMSNESGQTSDAAQEGAMQAMAKICEDNAKMLERELNGQRPLNFILPKLIEATKSPLPKVRVNALMAINVFTPRRNQAMLNSIDGLMQHLFSLASDSNPDVRRQVCRAFVQLVETRPDKLQPHLAGLVDYIITQQKADDEELACDAAEFWLAVGEHEDLWKSLDQYISKIIPVLLECMVYSGEEIALLGGASDDEDEEDREEDIKPQFAKKSSARMANGEGSADAPQNGNAYEKLANMDDDLEEGEIDGFEDGDDANPDDRWTLRKCSAAALDVFARDFRSPVFECILPYLTEHLKHNEWPYREAAVLALGAVAEGCIDVVTPHLPELVPYLISLLNDTEPVVRQITCWTLGRYSSWAARLTDQEQKRVYFEPMMEGILTKMLDRNKKVQEAAASAFANLEEKAGKRLEPYALPIIQQYVRCFHKYKDRNMYILYDCVQTLAEHIGPVLARQDLSNELMPALTERWTKVSDQSRELFPLLECLSYVAMAMNDAFTPYAQPIFGRCVNIIHQNLEASLVPSNPTVEVPEKDFLVTSLDLLSAIVQALDMQKSATLVESSQPAFFELLTFCMEDPDDGVRQSAYALLGDCAKYVYEQLKPALPSIMPALMKQLDLDSMLDEDVDNGFNIVNNACWSAGEIAIQHKSEMAPYVPELFQRFIETMTNPGIPKGVTENAAIALGRLGLGNADLLAPHLANFAEDFLMSMDEVDLTDEKATAFRGFTVIVEKNPMAMEKSLLHFFTAIARYRDMRLRSQNKTDLHEDFQKTIGIYRQIIPQFDQFFSQLQPQDQEALRATYAF